MVLTSSSSSGGREKLRVVGQAIPDVDRQAEHPLSHRGIHREDIVHQARRRVRHPPTGARGAKAPSLAGVTHLPALAAVIAPDSHKTIRQNPTLHVVPQLAFHVPRQPEVRRLGLLQERLQMLDERAVQHLPLRLAPEVDELCPVGIDLH